MKKLIIAAAIVCAATISQAAAVGWTAMNAATDFRGGDYSVFVIGLNGVTSANQIQAIVAAGGLDSAASYAFFAGGDVASNGAASKGPAVNPIKEITYSGSGTDTYNAFIVMQNADGNKGAYTANASISLANNTDGKTFLFGNIAGATTFAVAPEPTSGLLLLLGVAGLALRRRRA